MATQIDDDEEERPSSSSTRSRGGSRSRARSAGGGALALLNTAAVFDIVDRLGLVDLVVDRIKSKLDEVDVDELLDEIGDYLKRNPEVLVVSLGAVTIAAGALVYLNRRNEGSSRARSNAGESGSSGGSRSGSGSRSSSSSRKR